MGGNARASRRTQRRDWRDLTDTSLSCSSTFFSAVIEIFSLYFVYNVVALVMLDLI